MLLMIDNYDSFTFNLVHYFRALGQEVQVYRNDKVTIEQIEQLKPNYIVISPGPKEPKDAGISLQIIAHFVGITPILGVCLGHQCIAQHFGAKIIKAKTLMHGKTSMINHSGQGLFANIDRPMQVTRYHSLIVDRETLPDELMISAWTTSSKGDIDDIMALQHRSLPLASVQFHPESVLTTEGMECLKNFIYLYSSD